MVATPNLSGRRHSIKRVPSQDECPLCGRRCPKLGDRQCAMDNLDDLEVRARRDGTVGITQFPL